MQALRDNKTNEILSEEQYPYQNAQVALLREKEKSLQPKSIRKDGRVIGMNGLDWPVQLGGGKWK